MAQDDTVFDAVLYPHRSLGAGGFRVLLGGVCLASTILSIPFYILGAWPVVGFFGVDVALLYLCFRLNYRDARIEERVLLTHVSLLVSRMDPRGRYSEWRFNPLWVSLKRDEHHEFGVMRLAFVQTGRELEVARFLGAEEKAAFADAVAVALSVARKGPVDGSR